MSDVPIIWTQTTFSRNVLTLKMCFKNIRVTRYRPAPFHERIRFSVLPGNEDHLHFRRSGRLSPPANVEAGSYKIPVRAATGTTSAELELEVVVTLL